jgi:endonuclease YncB( thermonuclease family)
MAMLSVKMVKVSSRKRLGKTSRHAKFPLRSQHDSGAAMKLTTVLALIALVLMFLWAQRVNQRPDPLRPETAGRAQAIDGDSLMVNGQTIRLQGIDAPEYNQTCQREGAEYRCGRDAAQALRRLLAQGEVICRGFEYDRYNRLLGTCTVAGDNIAARLVREGFAVSYGDYLVEEAKARNEKKGLWAGAFANPREWRREHPRQDAPQGQPPPLSPVDVPAPPGRPKG